jgi:polyhydroxyalkanoate synthesis repressor PhaR
MPRGGNPRLEPAPLEPVNLEDHMIRVIKRYESRKLYDTEESRYISVEDIAAWVREGQEVRVLDNATSDDVTAQILTQIIHDEGKQGRSFLPNELLHELVRFGEQAVSSGVEQVQGTVDRLFQASIDRLGPVRRAREEMSHLRDRLGTLERTLETLEASTEAAPAVEKKAPAKTAPKRKTARKQPARAAKAS